jgi:hypothetical protein
LHFSGSTRAVYCAIAANRNDFSLPVTARRICTTIFGYPFMAKEFDPYREKLVMEEITVWPDELDRLEAADRLAAEAKLHADPDKAAHLEYIRQHTGFARKITVTAEDLTRIGMA